MRHNSATSSAFVEEGGDGKESEMPVDRTRRGVQDRGRINLGEEYEVEYWTKTLGISRARLTEIIRKVGDGVEAVRREVGRAPVTR
jgi:hypothetical protein